MSYLEIANHPLMWLAACAAVSVVVIQSIVFVRKSIVVGRQIGLTDEQMLRGVKSSAYSSIGPSIVVMVGMISLIVTMGGALSWMRLSFIGAVSFELLGARFGAEAMGASLGPDMSAEVFANAAWTMILGSIGWLVVVFFFNHKMDKLNNIISKGNKAILPIVASGAMLGAFATLNADYLVQMDASAVASVCGIISMMILVKIANTKNIQWLKEWALTISMFSSMAIGSLF